MKPLRIAMVFPCNPGRAGGMQVHIRELTRYLRSFGHKVTLFGPDSLRVPPGAYHVIGKQVLGSSLHGNRTEWILPDSRTCKAFKRIDTRNYDLCHLHNPFVPLVPFQFLLSVSIPKIVTFHEGWDDRSWINIFNPIIRLSRRFLSSKIAGIVYISDITRRRWSPLVSKDTVYLQVPNGIDPAMFTPRALQKSISKVELLFIGRLVPRKGLMDLLRALVRLEPILRERIHLTVVGDGQVRRKAEEFVIKHSLSSCVEFVGEVLGIRRVEYFRRADIFCAPYRNEAFSIAYVEAMACGNTIVGYANEATRQLFRTYPAQRLFVSKKNYTALARAIAFAMNHPHTRREIAHWCIREARQYDWAIVARQTESLYYESLAKRLPLAL